MRAFRNASWTALFLAAAASFLVECGLLGQPVAPDLTRLPARLGSLEVLDELSVDPAALGQDPPERHTYRRVRDAEGREGQLFVAYYRRAQRWSGRPHDVEKCYASLGWEEREARRLPEAHRPWLRRFEREGESIRVVHWLERPGADADQLDWSQLVARVTTRRGFRPDVASVYIEFEDGRAPDDAVLVEAVAELSEALEALW